MKILLTGTTGFVGSHLLPVLLNNSYEVIALVHSVKPVLKHDQLTVISLSDSDWKQQVKASEPEIIVHLAAHLTSSDNDEAIVSLLDSNISFGTHLLDAVRDLPIKAFINTGTFAEYAKNDGKLMPAYLYAATKTAFRSVLAYYKSVINFKLINVIPYTIYGARLGSKKLIDLIYESTISIDYLNMSPGEQVLDFIHINDVVGFYLLLIRSVNKINDEIHDFHLGTGIGSTPRKLATIIEKITARKTKINWGGIPYRKTDTMHCVALFSEINNILFWKPVLDLEDGVALYVATLNDEHGV